MIRRRKPVETKVNHDRWLVSYADLVTLLFAFFVVMYSVSRVNQAEYKELSQTLNAAFKTRAGVEQTQPLPPVSPERVSMAELTARVNSALNELIQAEQVRVRATDDWVEVSMDADLLFESGSAAPSDQARTLFAQVGGLLAPYDNAVDVSGHTDTVPIQNAAFANNWELSAARATSVVRLLADAGVAPQRLAATGYGEFRPVADNTTEEGRAQNRRVVLMVARHQSQRPAVTTEALPQALNEPAAFGAPEAAQNAVEPGTAAASSAAASSATEAQKVPLLQPVIRADGSLLFTSDPDRAKTE